MPLAWLAEDRLLLLPDLPKLPGWVSAALPPVAVLVSPLAMPARRAANEGLPVAVPSSELVGPLSEAVPEGSTPRRLAMLRLLFCLRVLPCRREPAASACRVAAAANMPCTSQPAASSCWRTLNTPVLAAGRSYYINAISGRDTHDGKSSKHAWRTFSPFLRTKQNGTVTVVLETPGP